MELTFLSILTLKCCAQPVIGLTVFVAVCVVILGPFSSPFFTSPPPPHKYQGTKGDIFFIKSQFFISVALTLK